MQDNNLLAIIDRYKLPIGLSILGLVLIIGGIFTSGKTLQKSKQFPKESLVESTKMIAVDVSGAVNKPGVYKLKEGLRVEQAIAEAGGFSETANGEYISKSLNLAQKLTDGTKIYVPVSGEAFVSQAGSVAGANSQPKININSASSSEIESLPDIGPVTASKIISSRPYQSIDELASKKIVSKAVFEKIKESVVVY